jgi:drug/metabolite transporter (DMT)-like permease
MRNLLVFSTVLLQVLASLILDLTAKGVDTFSLISLAVILGVFALHGVRFIFWGYIHKKYDLSQSYPLIAVFFPIIFIIALIKGDTELSVPKILGLLFIVIGIVVSNYKTERK